MKFIAGIVQSQDEVIKKTALVYIDDLYVNEDVVSARYITDNLSQFELLRIQKT